jgi:hypothetical protein
LPVIEGCREPIEPGIRSWRRSLAAAVNIAFMVISKVELFVPYGREQRVEVKAL